MKMLHSIKGRRGRAAILGLIVAGAVAGSASAAVSTITIDSDAQLSPGRMHATLTGTVTCDAGSTASLTGRIVQTKSATGSGQTSVTCSGEAQPYAIDVSTAGGFPFPLPSSGVFKPGKANAQVSSFSCDPSFTCTTTYTDAIIRLTK